MKRTFSSVLTEKYLYLFGIFVFALLQSACSICSVNGQAAQRYTGGTVLPSGYTYESSAVDAPLLHFPAGRVYEFEHGLGARPVTINTYVSFCEQLGRCAENDLTAPGNIAESAGNQAVIEEWNDEFIRIRNDTCAEFYVRLVAALDPAPLSNGLGGMGGMSSLP
ncbi:MAG: hypothetical protein MK135_07640 [Polyangiaceae bacterium]|nr:hypothetical protein [Polyangiaceae bacterium]